MRLTDWTLLVVLSVLWGGSFLFNEIALTSAAPLTVVAVRVSVAATALVVYCVAAGIRVPLTLTLIVGFAVMGLINNVIPFNLIAWGQTRITGGVASILNATTPLFTVIVAHLWARAEPATPARLAGVVVGFFGVAVLVGIDNLGTLGREVAGQGAVLLGAFSYAVSALWGKRLTAVAPIGAAAAMLTASSVVLVPAALILGEPFDPMPTAQSIAAMIALAILSSALAYVIFYRILASAGSNVMLVTFLIPVTAIALGAAILGEAIETRHLAGLALIFCGLALVDGRVVRLVSRAGRASS